MARSVFSQKKNPLSGFGLRWDDSVVYLIQDDEQLQTEWFLYLYRWRPGSGEENISEWEPLGLGAHLLVACTGGIITVTERCLLFKNIDETFFTFHCGLTGALNQV